MFGSDTRACLHVSRAQETGSLPSAALFLFKEAVMPRNSNDKPFLTVKQQVDLLESRGVAVPDRGAAEKFLLTENYYTVVNGYRDVFIDPDGDGEQYADGVTFDHIRLLYLFDRFLRRDTMDVLMESENIMKTALIYSFCDNYRDPDAYLDPASYCSRRDYRLGRNYTRNLIRLLGTLQDIRDNKHHKPYIAHYNSNHGCLPLWVASKCLTFGNLSAFYDLQTQSVQSKTCAAICRATGKSYIKQTELAYAFHTLPDFRNICAHDERLYCARAGKNGDKAFPELFRALRIVLPEERFIEYVNDVRDLIHPLSSELLRIDGMILARMGLTSEMLDGLCDGR